MYGISLKACDMSDMSMIVTNCFYSTFPNLYPVTSLLPPALSLKKISSGGVVCVIYFFNLPEFNYATVYIFWQSTTSITLLVNIFSKI